ncbi:MAG: glutathione transferase GstA [Burkholderiales bacterium]|nr:MAG: glutathione transferase GstA [Burkholderiales bacterium]TAG78597.1 MAG: glutathione transferase GstA [Betaproteobacteria bacterium]
MKLYYSNGACSLSPHIVLREAGIPFDLVRASTKTHKLDDGTDYYTINPTGAVPMLELDNGERLSEGPAIVQYIADLAPQSKLAPANGTFERARLQEMLNFITSELHKGYSPLFKPDTPDAYKPIAQESLKKKYAHIDAKLAGRDYLMGDTFTVADAYLFTVTSWAKYVNLDLSEYKNVLAHSARVAARPHVQEALKAEGLLK